MFQEFSSHRQSCERHRLTDAVGLLPRIFLTLTITWGIKAAGPVSGPGGFYLVPSGCMNDRVHFGWCRDWRFATRSRPLSPSNGPLIAI